MRAFDHATWLGGGIFDGARAFEGVTPDLDHCARARCARPGQHGPGPAFGRRDRRSCATASAGSPRTPSSISAPSCGRPTAGWRRTRQYQDLHLAHPDPLPDPSGTKVCLSRFAGPSAETRPPTPRRSASMPRQAAPRARPMNAASTTGSCWILLATWRSSAPPISGSPGTAPRSRRPPNGTFLNGLTRQR